MHQVIEVPSGDPAVKARSVQVHTPPPFSPDGPEQGVIEEARRRQRNRRLLLTGIAAAAILVAGLAHLGAGGAALRPRPTALHPRTATPKPPAGSNAMFAQPPSMGVACRVPNSIACDRVGLSVWLRRPAVSVDATIDGRRLRLDDPLWSGPARDGRRTRFAGFLQPAGIVGILHVRPDATDRWYGTNAPSTAVRLAIDYGRGRAAVADVSVLLTPGWG